MAQEPYLNEMKEQTKQLERELPYWSAFATANVEAIDAATDLVNTWISSEGTTRTEIMTAYPALHQKLKSLYESLVSRHEAHVELDQVRQEGAGK